MSNILDLVTPAEAEFQPMINQFLEKGVLCDQILDGGTWQIDVHFSLGIARIVNKSVDLSVDRSRLSTSLQKRELKTRQSRDTQKLLLSKHLKMFFLPFAFEENRFAIGSCVGGVNFCP